MAGHLPSKKDLLTAFAIGAAVNFPWEMAHSRLYRGGAEYTWREHLVCCGLAALADGLGIAALFATGALLFRDPRWTRSPSSVHIGVTALLGLLGAVLTEGLALRLGWWDYGPAMPRLPGTALGLSPLAQFVVLPLVTLFWALPRGWARDRTGACVESVGANSGEER